jgi:uncharacterized protein involved in exopolysaccharide biosynthesis
MNSVIVKTSFEPPPQSSTNSAPGGSVSEYIHEFMRSIRMHRVLATLVAIVVFAAIVAFGLRHHPYYQASALVYVQPMQAKQLTDLTAATYDPNRYDTFIQQQLQTIVRSDTVTAALRAAVKTTGYDGWSLPGESEQSAVARLGKGLKVEREENSYQLSISLSGGNPEVIIALVNAVADSYINQERLDELAQSDQQLRVLEEERQHIQGELEKDRQEQAELNTNLGVADSGEKGNPYDPQLTELRTQLAAAHAAHAVAEAHLASITGTTADASAALSAAAEETSATDPGLAALKSTISQRRSILATQMAGLTPKSNLYKQDQEELKTLDQSLESMSNEIRAKNGQQLQERLQLEATRTGDIEARLASQLQRQTAIATAATPKLQRASALAEDLTRLQGHLTDVENAISALELEHGTSGLVHLLLHASLPLSPVASMKVMILAASLPCGIVCGLLAAFLKHKLDPRIYIGADVAAVLSFPPMAVLPKSTEVDAKVLDEFMLRLVAGIDQAHCLGGARTYVFSPASSDTNITDLVASLASKMDRLGYRTMILKASDVLQNLSLGGDGQPKIWYDPPQAKQTETRLAQISGESFVVENLERLKQNVDILFIEALPFLSSAEAEFAARLADVTIIVAESAKTTRRELTSSLALARRLSVPGLAAVLDDVELRNADDEFIAFVSNVEGRQAVIRRRDDAAQRKREKYPLSIYASEDPIAEEHNASSKR